MDFVKNKVILRTFIASIPPITIYSIGRALVKILKPTYLSPIVEASSYFNSTAWVVIFATALLYPISQVNLWMFFSPIESWLNKKLKVDNSRNPFLRGNFKPIEHEHAYEMVDVTSGKVPTDI